VSYWSRQGWNPNGEKIPGWACVFYSQEDAETQASTPKSDWVWDGNPAKPVSISNVMRRARRSGRPGVKVKAFSNGQWVTVHEYPAGEPIPEELRDEE